MALQKFFLMDGYGFYVWTAYGTVFLVLILNLIKPFLQKRRLQRQMKRLEIIHRQLMQAKKPMRQDGN